MFNVSTHTRQSHILIFNTDSEIKMFLFYRSSIFVTIVLFFFFGFEFSNLNNLVPHKCQASNHQVI